MEKLFIKFLEQSDKLRNGYKESISSSNKDWEIILRELMGTVPDIFKIIYGNVSGTYYGIENQKLLDFLPGYLLIHILEYKESHKKLSDLLSDFDIEDDFYPILQDYSSNFIALKAETNEIYHISSEDGESLMYESPLKFFETINDFYSKKVYFLDEDGFLDYDLELEGKIGIKNNPEIEYWANN